MGREFELSAKLSEVGREAQGPHGPYWRLTLKATEPDGVVALSRMTEPEMGDDHMKTLFLAASILGGDEISFVVFTGPDIIATDDQVRQLYLWRPQDNSAS